MVALAGNCGPHLRRVLEVSGRANKASLPASDRLRYSGDSSTLFCIRDFLLSMVGLCMPVLSATDAGDAPLLLALLPFLVPQLHLGDPEGDGH